MYDDINDNEKRKKIKKETTGRFDAKTRYKFNLKQRKKKQKIGHVCVSIDANSATQPARVLIN